jgi:hypothetical protein
LIVLAPFEHHVPAISSTVDISRHSSTLLQPALRHRMARYVWLQTATHLGFIVLGRIRVQSPTTPDHVA